nr:MAG TPA: hypothetical protein [Bacteriophage sp.]
MKINQLHILDYLVSLVEQLVYNSIILILLISI